MPLIKSSIPILEYDDSTRAVIMPDTNHPLPIPERVVFPFLGEEVEAYAQKHACVKIDEFLSATKTYPIYQTEYGGHPVCLCQAPVGSAPAAQLLDFLIGGGAKYIVSAGTCGALTEREENEFLVPVEALRCEGTSYHYLPPSRTVEIDARAVAAIERALAKNGMRYEKCKTWSTDGFFRETRALVEYRIAEGFSVVEMECSALAACAAFRGAVFGQILFTADTLADTEAHDARDWGRASYARALRLCFEAVAGL